MRGSKVKGRHDDEDMDRCRSKGCDQKAVRREGLTMLSSAKGRNRRAVASCCLAIRACRRWFEGNRLLDLGGRSLLLSGRRRSRWKCNTLGATHRRSFGRLARCRRRVRNLGLLHDGLRYDFRITLKECAEGIGRFERSVTTQRGGSFGYLS